MHSAPPSDSTRPSIQLVAQQLGKKYRREWIFRNLNLQLSSGNSYTFIGPNGSGKSTLLQILSGSMPPTDGALTYNLNGQPLQPDDWYRYVSMAAPYLELVEELTLLELLDFHHVFKPFGNGLKPQQVADQLHLGHAKHKEIKYFSSGMKQRVKLGLAFFSTAPVLILDEPTANLDRQGAAWYLEQVTQLSPDKLLLIGSNQPDEYRFCPNVFDIQQWK